MFDHSLDAPSRLHLKRRIHFLLDANMAPPLTDIDFTSLSPDEVLALATPPPEYEEVRRGDKHSTPLADGDLATQDFRASTARLR